jgi:CubicO group peptidase (beta-lactamase class C family)
MWATAVLDGRGAVTADGSDQVFPIYSATKTVLAVQVLQLGLDLSTPVARWLPGLPAAEAITVAQLLGHTSGLPDYGSVSAYHEAVRAGRPPWPDDVYLELAAEQGLLFTPGTGWAYSNIGYLALRRIVQAERDQPWADAVRHTVVARAGLTDTFPLSTPEDLARVAPARSTYLGGAIVAEAYHPGWVAHGLLACSAADLAHLFRLCLSDETGVLLPRATQQAMSTLRPLDLPGRPLHPRPAYGLGVMGTPSDTRSAMPVLGHTGAGPGYTAAVYLLPRQDRVLAALLADEDQTHAEGRVLALAQQPPG